MTNISAQPNIPYVDAQINFSIERSPSEPILRSGDVSTLLPRTEPKDVKIFDARAIKGDLSLDREGFVLISHTTAIKNFTQPLLWQDEYTREMAEVIKTLTGASSAVAYQGNTRYSPKITRDTHVAAAEVVAPSAHSDFTHVLFGDSIKHELAREKMQRQGIDLSRVARWRAFNVWRAVSPPPQDLPLALCDARSVSPEDITTAILDLPILTKNGGRITASVYEVHFNANQRWFYFSQLQSDELIVFSGYDGRGGVTHRVVPHCSFTNPTLGKRAVPRISIEARVVAFYDY